MKLILVFSVLLGLSATAQPFLKFLPPANFKTTNQFLFFDLAITNEGNQALILADRANNPHQFVERDGYLIVRNLFEVTLLTFGGRVMFDNITNAPFAFKSLNQPSIQPGEMVSSATGNGGVVSLAGVTNGDYTLIVRLNPAGHWPHRLFHEQGTYVSLVVKDGVVDYWQPLALFLAQTNMRPRTVARTGPRSKSKVVPPPLPGEIRYRKHLYRGRGVLPKPQRLKTGHIPSN